jgi:hypothetical protein
MQSCKVVEVQTFAVQSQIVCADISDFFYSRFEAKRNEIHFA